jgi:hypothetical protein
LRAKDEKEAATVARELFPEGTTEIDFIEEKPWEKYRDFAGMGSRFVIDERYWGEQIDDVATVRKRLEAQ